MRHGSLFSGIGGFDLAAEWAGFENVFQVEIDNYCQKVLAKNFPYVKRYKDIKEFDGTQYRGAIDIVSGGFPCQPFSVAGKQKGAEDDRNLWPEMFRVIKEIGPSWVVGENVANIINFVEFEHILTDLECEGYEVQTFIIPALAVDAKHRRNRVWIVAYNDEFYNDRSGLRTTEISQQQEAGIFKDTLANAKSQRSRSGSTVQEYGKNENWISNDKENGGQVRSKTNGRGSLRREECVPNANGKRLKKQRPDEPEKPGIERGGQWLPEPDVGRVANGVSRRVDRLKGLGNAVVPQIPYRIFRAIKEIHEND